MRAIRLNDSTAAPALILDTVPERSPGDGELLIRVSAAAVTPTELQWYPTSHTKGGAPRKSAIPGHEFSGIIAGKGPGVDAWELGQPVFGMNDWFSEGAMAEFCTAPASAVCLKPSRMSHSEAASVPISALTAWQGLFDRTRIRPGERLLVHGAAGAVGCFVVQLAHRHGAHVVATASRENAGFVTSLGAKQVIDYRSQRFEDAVSDVDVVFDTVGGETLRRSWSVLKPNGRLVTIAAGEESTTDARIKQAFLLVEPNHDQLTAIAQLLETGELRAVVDTVVPLTQAPDAFAGTLPRQHRGKIVVTIAEHNSYAEHNS